MKSTGKSQCELRTQAEEKLAASTEVAALLRPSAEALLHELQVHQIELQMQNAALREAQLALEESRDRYMNLFEFAPVGYLTLNSAGFITEINLAGARFIGRERTLLIDQRFSGFVTTPDRDHWQRAFLNALTCEIRQTCEVTFQHGNAPCLTVMAECQPALGTEGRVLMHVVLTDISALKQTMNELAEQADHLRLAKDATALGIFDDHLLSGNHHFDQRLREIWGFDRAAPVSFDQVIAGIHPDDRMTMLANVDRALDPLGDGRYAAEYRVINVIDGHVSHVIANGQVFFDHLEHPHQRKPTRFVGTVKDVSEQVGLLKDIRERRGAMQKQVDHQVATQTAVAIAHEINQPLVAISAYSEAALRMLRQETQTPKKLVLALEGAAAQAQRAGRTLHELLEILDKGDSDSAVLDLNELVREAVAIAADSGFGEVIPVFELDETLPRVAARRLQVLKVIVNLLHNSVDAMSAIDAPLRRITITVRRSTEQNMAQITVRDSGKGIAEGIGRQIFEPFFTTKAGGLGLGLAISRKLIEAQGGQLWLDQGVAPGLPAGTAFHFTLPFAP